MTRFYSEISLLKDKLEIRQIITNQVWRYRLIEIPDLYKLFYQATMGSEHAISSEDKARVWLEREVNDLPPGPDEPMIDPISPDGKIVRVNLRPFVFANRDITTLLDAFVKTANVFRGKKEILSSYWAILEGMATKGELAFELEELKSFIEEMDRKGFPAIHHSSTYKEAYKPAYRIIVKEFL